MRDENEVRVWIVTGAVGAMVLGIVLIPLRTLTAAANLAFVFVAFTIIVAELGGRQAALVTAVVSAMSLNFFLTEPYLTLTISKSDDVIAFLALTACGLIAAAFGTRRVRWSEVAGRAGKELAVLSGLKGSFGLGALVLRDPSARVLDQAASASPGQEGA